jgi:hypothetical protein
MKERYVYTKFKGATAALIDTMNGIVSEYVAQGFVLTVRQLYYQLVARGVIENTERSYKRTTSMVNDARLAGAVRVRGSIGRHGIPAGCDVQAGEGGAQGQANQKAQVSERLLVPCEFVTVDGICASGFEVPCMNFDKCMASGKCEWRKFHGLDAKGFNHLYRRKWPVDLEK